MTTMIVDDCTETRVESLHKGLRYNDGKLRYDLFEPFAQEQLAKVFTIGAKKYAPRNWEKGMAWSNVLASLKRHLAAIERGEDYDPETGLLHSAHVSWNAMALTSYYKIYPQGDDRQHSYLKAPKIGLDIDEVLCDWLGDWIELCGINERPHSWYFHRDIRQKFEEMRNLGTINDFYLNLKPLMRPEDLPFEPHCYITSRPVDVEVTTAWLDKHNFPTKPVYCVGVGQSKAEVAKKSGIDIFVDDCYDNFVTLNKAGICTFLLDAPHNRRYDVGYKRIKSLKELV